MYTKCLYAFSKKQISLVFKFIELAVLQYILMTCVNISGLSPGCLFTQKILRKLGHRAVSSDEEESAVKPDGPSEKAWGKRKAVFYSTDYIDDELGG